MKLNATSRYQEHPISKPRADWFDESHDSVLILESRDYEENGASPRAELFYQCA